MNSLPRFVVLAAVLSVAGLSSCGTTPQQQCASTCSGCCTAAGVCEAGTSQLGCGSLGGECTQCALSQQCQLGGCVFGTNTGGGGGGGGGGGTTGGGGGGGGGCVPTTCAMAGATCGTRSDGCGGTVDCGTCQSPESCGGSGMPNRCGVGTCTPTTCAAQSKNCGSMSDGCAGTLSCGTCQSPQVCGAANLCVSTCVPRTCAEASATCGSPSDGCGGSLSCGTCSGTATCGGGGLPFTCGATCTQSCPAGWTCNAQGACAGGNQSGITLNVVQAATVTITGSVTLNGAQPGSSCSSSDRATVTFTSPGNSNYTTSVSVPCNAATTPFTWTAQLYPSTYSVSVRGGNSALPGWSIVVNPAFTVSGPAANVVLDVVQAPTVAVSGSVTHNGAQPGSACSSSDRATVTFTSSNPNYNTTVSVPCNGATTPFTWTAQLYPSTYSVSVRGGNSTLPGWNIVTTPSLTVSGPQSNVVLNVVQPPTVAVSGTVTHNGLQPGSACSSSDRATVIFTSASNNNYNTSVSVPCNGASTPFTWTTQLYPSTYSVSVRGGNSTLPGWSIVVNPGFTVSGPSAGVTLNVVQAAAVAVSGSVTFNGLQPTSVCSSSDRATVIFTSSNTNYNTTVSVPCNGATTPFTWTGQLYPATYSVSVRGGNSNLPGWSIVVNPALTVSGPQSNVVLNVVQASAVSVSGSVTLNGAQPTSSCSSSDRATVIFTSPTNSNFNTTVSVPCNGASTPFTWTAQLYPSTYAVSVRGGNSGLPGWTIVVNPALTISGAQSNVGLDVVQAPTVMVSGTVTLNGLQPSSMCSSSDRATVLFTSTNPNYSTSVSVPCNGASTPFTWTAQLYPSTYAVSVRGGNSGLPGWSIQVISALEVR